MPSPFKSAAVGVPPFQITVFDSKAFATPQGGGIGKVLGAMQEAGVGVLQTFESVYKAKP